MVFVNERIPKEEWKKKGFTRWTIDRDRGYCLIRKGGGNYGAIHFFELQLGEQIVKFETECHFREKDIMEVYQKIFMLIIPDDSKLEKKYIMKVITEALNIFGFMGSNEEVKVIIQFAPHILEGIEP